MRGLLALVRVLCTHPRQMRRSAALQTFSDGQNGGLNGGRGALAEGPRGVNLKLWVEGAVLGEAVARATKQRLRACWRRAVALRAQVPLRAAQGCRFTPFVSLARLLLCAAWFSLLSSA